MAGSEKMGVSAARADLFLNAACVVTPSKNSANDRVEETEALWRDVGGRVIRLDPETHDLLVSRSSHLPHVLAAQLAIFVLDQTNPPDQAKLCANGFRDSTRIAAGSPEMWRDIVVMNRKHVLDAVKHFGAGLEAFRARLEQNDPEALEEFFKRAKELRDEWTGRCASSSPE